MAVERFTRHEFELALPEARLVGYYGRELVYEVPTMHPRVVIRIHSSINVRTGRADETGENSIRMYLFHLDCDRSLGKGDGTEYTARVSGWERRLREKLAALQGRVRVCQTCNGPAVVRTVKKAGPNKGRGFWVCLDKCCWGGWADEQAGVL
jgi:hypothetical protein